MIVTRLTVGSDKPNIHDRPSLPNPTTAVGYNPLTLGEILNERIAKKQA